MAKISPKFRAVFLVAAVSAMCFAGDEVSQSGSPRSAPRIEAITRPSGDVVLSFVRRGLIAKVLVKNGDSVEAGHVLIQQDDAMERAEVEQLRLQAENPTRVKAAEAQLDQKKVDLKKIEWAAERGAATELEVEHTRLDVLIAELSLELSQFQQDQDRRKYIQTKIILDRMCLKSPIAGVVEQVTVEPGEAVDELAPVIRVVKIDPLWIDVPVPRLLALKLRCGGAARVEFGPHGEQAGMLKPQKKNNVKVVEGKVIHVASVADAASNTLTVRVEVPNPSKRPAGEHVKVYFPQHVAAGKSHLIGMRPTSDREKVGERPQ